MVKTIIIPNTGYEFWVYYVCVTREIDWEIDRHKKVSFQFKKKNVRQIWPKGNFPIFLLSIILVLHTQTYTSTICKTLTGSRVYLKSFPQNVNSKCLTWNCILSLKALCDTKTDPPLEFAYCFCQFHPCYASIFCRFCIQWKWILTANSEKIQRLC